MVIPMILRISRTKNNIHRADIRGGGLVIFQDTDDLLLLVINGIPECIFRGIQEICKTRIVPCPDPVDPSIAEP